MLEVPVSVGEVLDKISILQIKSERITDARKLVNVEKELFHLTKAAQGHRQPYLENQLKAVNTQLWEIEDRIRVKEKQQEFDNEFIQLARAVYQTNDRRAEIKKQINEITNSALIEEKFYA